MWEEIKAEEERRAVEEAELFKTKARSTDIATEEQVRGLHALGLGLCSCQRLSRPVIWD